MKIKLVACYDRQRRTCLEVDRCAGDVRYIPLNTAQGLEVLDLSAKEFDSRYMPMIDYPADRATQLYLGYAQTIGATTEALEYLGKVITITKQEHDMATSKKKAIQAATEKAKEAAEKKTAKAAKKATGKPAADKPVKAVKAATAKGEKRETAAQLFQDLIMAGKLTDAQIFAKVQEKFGLDDNKRGYVNWYRKHLEKNGKKPPTAKE